MLEKVRQFIETHNLLQPGESVVVGVSGGADSLCLLDVLFRLRIDLGLDLHVAHLNHLIRGDQANQDVEFVRAAAARMGLPFTAAVVDVPFHARETGMTLEEAGREARYAFLFNLCSKLGARCIAIAHSADDQIETVAMHWIRGAGLGGLRGILPLSHMHLREPEPIVFVDHLTGDRYVKVFHDDPVDDLFCTPTASKIRLVRPLLSCFRTEIEAYCRDRGIEYLIDPSNESLDFFRNRLRHELIPLLESYNPRFKELALRSAGIMTGDYEYILSNAAEAWGRIAEVKSDFVRFPKDDWLGLPAVIQRYLIREAIRCLIGSARNLEWKHIAAAVDTVRTANANTKTDLPEGIEVLTGYDDFLIGRAGTYPEALRRESEAPIIDSGERALKLCKIVQLANGWTVEAMVLDRKTADTLREAGISNQEALLDFDVTGPNLKLRSRRPGDRFCPLGLGGSKSLQDFMVNAKIEPWLRDYVPVLTAGDEIAWLAGWRIDDRFKITDKTSKVLYIRLGRLESEGGSVTGSGVTEPGN